MNNHTPQQIEIEFPQVKLCECGCGEPAPIAKKNNKNLGHVKGQPVRFIRGHVKARPAEERFWEKVDRRGPDECWLWTAHTSRTGYGQLRVGSIRDGTARRVQAHRFSYELHNGEIPDGMCVCHNCPGGDNPSCCNPAHLWLGTTQENTQDMVDKGRSAGQQGTHVGCAKLTPEKVRRIRELAKIGMGHKSIARQFGVGRTAINRIVNRKRWKHVT